MKQQKQQQQQKSMFPQLPSFFSISETFHNQKFKRYLELLIL